MDNHDKQRRALLACFVVLLLHALLTALNAPLWQNNSTVFSSWMFASLAWWLAIRLAANGQVRLRSVVLGAILLRCVTLVSWPELSDDIYRYVWEGELVTRGISPYAFAPNAPELARVAAEMPELHQAINHPSISASYPPLTEAVFALLVFVERFMGLGSILLIRIFFALADLLVIVPLVSLLRRTKQPLGLVLAWAWSPLVIAEFAGSGHFDSLGILLMMASLALFAAAGRSLRRLGQLVLAGAILIKYIPLAVLPFVARGSGNWKRVLVVSLIVVAAFLPLFAMHGGPGGMFAGLGEYGLRWQSSGLVHPHLAALVDLLPGDWFPKDEGLLDARRIVRLILGGLWLGVALLVWRKKLDATHSTGILLGAFLVLSPTLHPWYVTWIVPFIALRPRFSWAWLASTIPLTYLALSAWNLEGVWQESPLVLAVIAIPFFLALALEVLRFLREKPSVEAVRV